MGVTVLGVQHRFLSTLSLRRATRRPGQTAKANKISIHALLAESDARRASRQHPAGISIHALLAESDRVNEDRYGQQF